MNGFRFTCLEQNLMKFERLLPSPHQLPLSQKTFSDPNRTDPSHEPRSPHDVHEDQVVNDTPLSLVQTSRGEMVQTLMAEMPNGTPLVMFLKPCFSNEICKPYQLVDQDF